MVKKKLIVALNDKNYFNTRAKDQFQKQNCILEALKYFKTYLENENLICMYMSYWGNLNLHIDVHEIIFSSPSTFRKYYCSSSLFMPWFNPSLSLSDRHTHSISRVLSFSQVHAFASVSFWMAFAFYPIFKCSWPFTPDLSPHFLVIFLTLTFTEDAHSYLYRIYCTCILLGE